MLTYARGVNLEEGMVNKKITILSDRQTAVMAVNCYHLNSKLVWDGNEDKL